MRFQQLLSQAGVSVAPKGDDPDITSVVADSRRCCPGSCFIAVRGPDVDGHQFIPAALAAGAVAVVCEDASDVPADVPVVVLTDTKTAVGPLAQAFHDWPSRKLTNIGVTGTNGKSTITYLVRAILAHAGHRASLLGTISYETGKRSVSASNTTPGPIELAAMMAEMVANGQTHLVMEVSSHALHQGRVSGIDYAAAIFTNLTGDHLDYHKTPEAYLAAKSILFEGLAPAATAVINVDDPAGEVIAKATRAKVVFYGLSPLCDVRARIDHVDEHGTRYAIRHGEGETMIASPLIGRHNVYNCLAAAGACRALGVPWTVIAEALSGPIRVPGRLERVAVPAPFTVFVDYAHTDDAMKNVLSAARPVTRGKLVVLFGCGGNRDRTKRPRMARVAEEFADRIIITSDNPRNEQPQDIINEIVAGLSESGSRKTQVEPDRKRAIEMAIAQASDGDVILLAGKGHENYQIVGSEKHHFDDVEIAAECMRQREAAK